MKFLARLEEQRQFLKLYHDDTITAVNINRTLDVPAKGLKELQDLVKSLKASSFITHFTHHSDAKEVYEGFTAEQQIAHLQSQLTSQAFGKSSQAQQQSTRERVYKQMQPLQAKLPLIKQITQIVKQALPENKSLTYLDLAKTFMRDDLAISLAPMFAENMNLLHLNLSSNSLTEKGGMAIAAGLARNNSLTYLDVSHNSLTPKFLAELAATLESNSQLNHLNLSYNSQGNQVLASTSISTLLENSKLISHLNLEHMQLGVEGSNQIISSLNEYSALKYLSIAANGLNVGSAEVIASLLASEDSTIEYLDLSENRFNIEGLILLVEALRENTMLRHLDIRQVGAAGREGGACIAKLLEENHSIIILNVQNNALDYIGAKLIAESLKGNQSLVKVNIAGNVLDEAGLIYVAKALEVNNTLTTLDLANNNMQDAGIIYLAAALSINHNVQYLNLTNNQINDSGAEALASTLSFIKILNLSNNQIRVEGAKFLAASLNDDLPLTTLILDKNPLQYQGVMEILSALKSNQTLHTLGLSGTGIGDNGIEQALPYLLQNTGLARLYLASNNITVAGAKHLADLIKGNACLTKLCLIGNRIDEQGEVAIAEMLPFSSLIGLTGLPDKSGMIANALSKNINLFQESLRQLASGQGGLDSKSLYILIKQLQARGESVAPELSYADMPDTIFYLREIAQLFQATKAEPSAGAEEEKKEDASNEYISDARFVEVLGSIDILGDIEIPADIMS